MPTSSVVTAPKEVMANMRFRVFAIAQESPVESTMLGVFGIAELS